MKSLLNIIATLICFQFVSSCSSPKDNSELELGEEIKLQKTSGEELINRLRRDDDLYFQFDEIVYWPESRTSGKKTSFSQTRILFDNWELSKNDCKRFKNMLFPETSKRIGLFPTSEGFPVLLLTAFAREKQYKLRVSLFAENFKICSPDGEYFKRYQFELHNMDQLPDFLSNIGDQSRFLADLRKRGISFEKEVGPIELVIE